jgi:hypothetical protein
MTTGCLVGLQFTLDNILSRTEAFQEGESQAALQRGKEEGEEGEV